MPIREHHSIHLMVVTAIIGAVAILYSPLSQALRPTVTWTPSILVETLAPGTTKTISVSFRSKKNIQNVAVTVAPSLQPFIQPGRSRFKKIPGKKSRHLGFVVSIPAGTPSGSHTGTIQLVRKKGNRTLRTPLHLTINIEPPGLPPDPGEEGKATIEGIDLDGNGVRDDIDRYIVFTYPDSTRKRMGMTHYARQEQKFLTDYLALQDNPTEQKRITRANSLERGKARECLLYTLGNVTESDLRKAIAARRTLTAQLLNTQDRQKIYLGADFLLAGTGGGDLGDDRTLCREFGFDPDTLPN